jgi:hypothetical protein
MDEGTLKTPTPLCRFHWSFCLGWWSNLVGSASGQKQSVKFLQNMIYTAQFTPHPQSLTVCINSTFSLGRGGGGHREERGAKVHKYSSFFHGGNSSQAGSKIPTNEWMYLQSIKSVKHNAAMYVNRSILKKSRHIGIGLLQCNLSTGPPFSENPIETFFFQCLKGRWRNRGNAMQHATDFDGWKRIGSDWNGLELLEGKAWLSCLLDSPRLSCPAPPLPEQHEHIGKTHYIFNLYIYLTKNPDTL